MKPIKASLLLPLLTILFSLALSGCYTQLAFVDDEQYSANEPSPYAPTIIIIPPTIPVCPPLWNPQPSPSVINPLPPSGYSPIVTALPSQQQPRDFGNQRFNQSENTQTASPVSESRPSGSKRGGR
jgi:hypothetical protein